MFYWYNHVLKRGRSLQCKEAIHSQYRTHDYTIKNYVSRTLLPWFEKQKIYFTCSVSSLVLRRLKYFAITFQIRVWNVKQFFSRQTMFRWIEFSYQAGTVSGIVVLSHYAICTRLTFFTVVLQNANYNLNVSV